MKYVALIAFTYFVLVGGTPAGDQVAALRIINGLIGAGLIAHYLWAMPRRSDATDKLVLAAVIVFLMAGVTSMFPRQSLDAGLTAVAYASAFYLLRRILAETAFRRLGLMLLGSLGLTLAVVFTVLWAGEWIQWLSITRGSPWPPLAMNLSAGHFGNQHDVAVLVVMLLPATWFGPWTRVQVVISALAGSAAVVSVLVGGSRNVLLAAAIASLVVALLNPRLTSAVRQRISRRLVLGVLAFLSGIVALTWASGLVDSLVARAFATSTIDLRGDLWGSSVEVWMQRPLTGYGPGGFTQAFPMGTYFADHSTVQRHPDNGAVQLLVEAGIVGFAAVILLGMAVVTARRPADGAGAPWQASWALVFVICTTVGANPTDYGFIVATALFWAGLAAAVPRVAEPTRPVRRSYGVGAATASLILLITWAATTAGTLAFDTAREATARGDLRAAEVALGQAISLDPGLALSWRERGSIRLLSGDLSGAERDLSVAAALAPTDDAAWRGLALTQLNAGEFAVASAERAVSIRPRSVLNQIVRLIALTDVGNAPAAADAAKTLVSFAPEMLADPAVASLLPPGLDQWEVLRLAADHWAARGDERRDRFEWLAGGWLAGLADRPQLLTDAQQAAPNPEALAILQLSLRCETSTALAIGNRSDQNTWELWLVRAITEDLVDLDSSTSLTLAAIASDEIKGRLADGRSIVDPLGNQVLDPWTYRRRPITHGIPERFPELGDALGQWISDAPLALRMAVGRQCQPPA